MATAEMKESFERSCRLCAEEQEVSIMIFSKEAEPMLLQNKLNQYLLIEVDENDKLPKNICIDCCTKLQKVCDFIELARKSQDILFHRSIALDDLPVELGNEEDIKIEPLDDEDSVHIQENIADENHFVEEESESSQMEISVDPSLVLQNSDCIDNQEENDKAEEEIALLPGLENEHVTIRLIKRSNQTTNTELIEDVVDEDITLEDWRKTKTYWKPYPCTLCDKSFVSQLALQSHNWGHCNEKRIVRSQMQCLYCTKTFSDAIDLMNHLNQHHESSNFDPNSPTDSLLEERKSKPNVKPFSCNSCKRSFLSELALKNHTWTHFNDDKTMKLLKCDTCDVSFDLKADLLNHLKEHRIKGTCSICGRVFRSEINLALHMDNHNSPSNSYECRVCHRQYNNISNLKTHSITHTNDRPFKCHLCKKCFKRNQDLKFHINQHTGAKPYKCPFCDKAFASSGNCYSHRSRMHPGRKLESSSLRRFTKIARVDTGMVRNSANTVAVHIPVKLAKNPEITEEITPKKEISDEEENKVENGSNKSLFKYPCTMCSHSFMKKDNYLYHMYKHTGVKPFPCSNCAARFVTRSRLYLHRTKVHPVKERPLVLLSRNALLQ